MTKGEIAKLIYVVKAAYPQPFARYTGQDLDNMIAAWQMVLEDVCKFAIPLQHVQIDAPCVAVNGSCDLSQARPQKGICIYAPAVPVP